MSQDHPLPDSYWVVPGKLLAGEYPGAPSEAEARRKLALLLDAGVRQFVDLTEAGEYALRPYWPTVQQLAAERGLEVAHERMSIPDMSAPDPAHMRAVLDKLAGSLDQGRPVYVHCFGGIGRTGTVVGCFLVEQGCSGRTALAEIEQRRRGTPDSYRRSPETTAQRGDGADMAAKLEEQPESQSGKQPAQKPARTVKIGRHTSPSSRPAPVETLVELTLTAMAPTGEAIGRHEGMVLFVPFGLPSEVVRVRIVERKRNFGRAELVTVVAASPQRVEPRCPYFGRCGGCDWQHADYAAQVQFKTAIVREQFARIGKLPDATVRPCIASPSAYEYRNHTRLALLENGHVGYRMARSHRLIEVQDCPILLPELRPMLADEFVVEEPEVDGEPDEVELQAWDDAVELGGLTFQVSPGSFFQANTPVTESLLAAVLAALPSTPGAQVLDLYCGVGLFTVPAALAGATVTGVESNAAAADDAAANLAQAGVTGTLVVADVLDALLQPELADVRWDTVILDPPREGVQAEALALLGDLDTPLLLYVSCEPATLARDVQALAERGWRLDWAQPFDMFPQTRHVETLAVLRR